MNILLDNIVIIDYQMGNLRSVQKAFEVNGCDVVISNENDVIKEADKIVLPGVGSFKDGMQHLQDLGLVDVLHKEVIQNKKPFLGICLGMHLIARKGYENGETHGLSWVNAEAIKFDFEKITKEIKVPHIGWNSAEYANHNNLFKGVDNKSDFYFVHSYHFKTKEDVVTSTTSHGEKFVSSIKKDNIYAFQFHPEKSQVAGLKIIKNFIQC
jgi:imidazole glycerol-phosphate synthase subunit HisH